MKNEKIYQLALTCIPNIGAVHIKKLLEHFENPESIFKASLKELKALENIGESRAKDIFHFKDFDLAEKEIKYIENNNIELLFYTDTQYPKRLKDCFDPPTVLFTKGNMHLNAAKTVAVVGTRNHSAYGKMVAEELIQYLKNQKDILVVSGLAFGIDGIAHQACLQNEIPTVGVLGNGLESIYPFPHKSLACKMAENNGGIISEFFHDVAPDKYNFPKRNRIVAGMSDVTVVIETAVKGGSVITANLANDYNRDVFAVPGKLTDVKSEGCNWLIANKKAEIYTSPKEFIQFMGWEETKKGKPIVQRQMFIDLDEQEMIIVKILTDQNEISIDQLAGYAAMSQGKTASVLLNLELKGIVQSLPGKRYSLI